MNIDGIDIEAVYNAKLLEGSLKSLVQHPPLKAPLSNDWAEEDGLEVDLTDPALDKRKVELIFLIDEGDIDSFVDFLMLKTYREYYSTSLQETYKLRFEAVKGINRPQGRCNITIQLIDDFPLYQYSYVEPILSTINSSVAIDGKNILEYGLILLDGSKASLDDKVEAKKKLEITSRYTDGTTVAEQESQKKSYEATLRFGIKQTVSNFISGYNGLLYDLTKADARELNVVGKLYNFYYVRTIVQNFVVLNGVVWCNFEVKIRVI